jgi:poly(A) polymerase
MKICGDWLTNVATQTVCRTLSDAGFQALLVGGCVRDALLDVPVTDIDIATDAEPSIVIDVCKSAGLHVIPTGFDHGTVTVVSGGLAHEITTFRQDVQTDGRHAIVTYSKNIEDDAKRRDFTMNALYADIDGRIIDPLGGLDDLFARRVRFIDDPAQRIREDYLRILRFFRFTAWYGDPELGLDPDALAAISTHIEGLEQLSRERVGRENRKLLSAPDPSLAVAAMAATGVLSRILPGSDHTALAPLVHLEALAGAEPDPIRRLAILGGREQAERLKLSKNDTAQLAILLSGISDSNSPARLGYTYGFEGARNICLLRAALLGQPFNPADMRAAQTGAKAEFPLHAADLMPELSGPALGARLKWLENKWIESGFALSRKDLLNLPES